MRALVILAILAAGEAIWLIAAGPQTPPSPATQPTTREKPVQTETATFAAGCFWGVQSTFEKVPGVISTRVGYSGGTMPDPTYEDVCTDRTGHAESIEIVFDPSKVSYSTLLNVFFENHDPTTMNRQGPDFGTQYRSVIFYHSPEQQSLAELEKNRRNDSGDYVGPIVTQIVPAATFYPAETYHQFYYDKHGITWTCHTGNGKRK
jgi:peptide-methionine (S)-S-oxide reductase